MNSTSSPAGTILKVMTCVVGLLALASALGAQNAAPTQARRTQLVETYGKLPLSFEPNQGQTDGRVRFLSRGAGYTLYLTNEEAVLALRNSAGGNQTPGGDRLFGTVDRKTRTAGAVLRMRLVGANPAAAVSGADPLAGRSNYFIGNDPANWRTNVPTYGRVKYQGVYPGVDLAYYGNQRQLEYDFAVSPGANPSAIQLVLTGLGKAGAPIPCSLHVAANGDLVVSAGGSQLSFRRPVVYQTVAGFTGTGPKVEAVPGQPAWAADKHFVEARYVLKGHNRIAFKLGPYDRRQPLIIDPVLTYATYLGGSGNDAGVSIAADSSGNAYVTGGTTSTDFPVPGGYQTTYGGGATTCTGYAFQCGDAFVTKINAAGSALIYSTYLGGSNRDSGYSIVIDGSENAYVAGETYSSNFPTTTGAFQTALGAGATHNGFITKLDAAGSALDYSTYLGGNDEDTAAAIAIDSSGDAYVAGRTNSTNFPTTVGAFQTTDQGGLDGFVTKLNSTGTALVYSTYLGGSGADAANGIAIDSSLNAYVAGQTASTNYPTLNAYQTVFAGGGIECGEGIACGDATLTKLNAAGSALLYSTYLGGAGEDAGVGIALDSRSNAYLVGGTDSSNFPVTVGAYQGYFGGGSNGCATTGLACGDAFVAKINTLGSGTSSLVFSTYLGGSGDDLAYGVQLDSSGYVHVSGGTDSTNFPVSFSEIQNGYGGGTASSSCGIYMSCGDAFLVTLTNLGSASVFSTYLGGSGDDFGNGLAVDSMGNVYLTGITLSVNFPVTAGAYDTMCGTDGNCNEGASDAFIAKVTGTATLPLADSPTLNVDFDGDGKADLPIWRASTGTWYVDTSSSGTKTQLFGESGDIPVSADYDGDGESDFAVWRPWTGTWYYLSTRTGATVSKQWGSPGDVPVPGDYDGDGKTDFAVWRPSTGTWYYIASSTGATVSKQWGEAGDIPVPGDYDGDGKFDFAVFRPSNGTWYYIASGTGATVTQQWGQAGDSPVEGDYNGDGKTDLAVWRPSNGTWYVLESGGGTLTRQWGEIGDIPVVGDYDGDHKNDYAVWRPYTGQWFVVDSSTGHTTTTGWGEEGDLPGTYLASFYRIDKHIANFNGDRKSDVGIWRPSNGTWYVIPSAESPTGGTPTQFKYGQSGDSIVPGDYDGDGKTDYAVWRPSNGTWYVFLSGSSKNVTQQWGENGDIPVPGDYDGDGKTDYAVWRPSTGTYYVILSSTGKSVTQQWGQNGDIPVPANYDGDGKTDYAIWRPSNGTWYILPSTGKPTITQQWGQNGDVPVPGDYDGDTKGDLAVFRPSNGTWYILQSSNGEEMSLSYGENGDVPVAKDYDGDEKTDIAIWRPSTGTWYIFESSTQTTTTIQWGLSTDVPVNKPTGQ